MNDIDFNRLNGPQRKVLRQTLMGVFSRKDLDVFLRDNNFGRLENLVEDGRFEHQVFELIEGLSRKGQLSDLMIDVHREFPRAPALGDLPLSFGFTDAEADQQRVLGGRGLERVVRETGFDDLFLWTNSLATAGRRVCRISYPVLGGLVRGTGFLVGRDLVLTNYHVIEHVLSGQADDDEVRLSFGYAETSDGLSEGDKYGLAQDWCVAHLPYGDADLNADGGQPAANELDFALLRLEKNAGEVKGAAGKRGWFDLEKVAKPVRDDAIVYVLQHPEGKPLKQSTGLLKASETPLRLLYDADTEKGSSGGLVLDESLSPIALHHAGDPDSKIKARYNQGIPLPLIHAALQASGGPPKQLRSSGAAPVATESVVVPPSPVAENPAALTRQPAIDPTPSKGPEPSVPLTPAGAGVHRPRTQPVVPSQPSDEVRSGPPLLFFSYAREDKALREQLAKQLKILERQRIIQTWYDGDIEFGTEREPAIRQKLREADIILLLASPDFLASDDIWERDLEIVKERREDPQDNVRVIPIILRPIVWDETPFKGLQPLPFDRQAISDRSGPNRDRAFAEIARAIRGIAVKISARR